MQQIKAVLSASLSVLRSARLKKVYGVSTLCVSEKKETTWLLLFFHSVLFRLSVDFGHWELHE